MTLVESRQANTKSTGRQIRPTKLRALADAKTVETPPLLILPSTQIYLEKVDRKSALYCRYYKDRRNVMG